jgi:hypothetical protein
MAELGNPAGGNTRTYRGKASRDRYGADDFFLAAIDLVINLSDDIFINI